MGRFVANASSPHILDDFIGWLETQDQEKTYVYTNSCDCLNARYQKAQSREYTCPGRGDTRFAPSQFREIVAVERIAHGAAVHEERRGFYSDALHLAKECRRTDTWSKELVD